MSHTPEPWKLVPRIRPDAGMTTQIVALPKAETIVLANEENAARIIAAVNGCTGLNPAAFRACVEALKLCKENLNNLLTPLSGQPDWALVSRTVNAVNEALALTKAEG